LPLIMAARRRDVSGAAGSGRKDLMARNERAKS
jgi:hypothetical protein